MTDRRAPQKEPDQAVGIAADVLNATQSLGAYAAQGSAPIQRGLENDGN